MIPVQVFSRFFAEFRFSSDFILYGVNIIIFFLVTVLSAISSSPAAIVVKKYFLYQESLNNRTNI